MERWIEMLPEYGQAAFKDYLFQICDITLPTDPLLHSTSN